MGFFIFILLFTAIPHMVVSDREKRIVGGRDAKLGEVPFIGSLRKPGGSGTRHSCGGTLISSSLILTAAHCDIDVDQDMVVVGYLNYNNPNIGTSPDGLEVFFGSNGGDYRGYQSQSYERVKMHANYDDDSLENDIALVFLKQPVEFNTYVSAITTSTAANPREYYSSCYIAGWGDTGPSTDATTLKLAQTTIVDGQECRDTYGDEVVFDDATMICAQSDDNDACEGDSGGPLYCMKGQHYELVGIVSSGVDICKPGDPGVYTKVAGYADWISTNSAPIPTMPMTLILVVSGALAYVKIM